MVYYKLFYKYIKYVMFYLLLFGLLTKKNNEFCVVLKIKTTKLITKQRSKVIFFNTIKIKNFKKVNF